MKKTALTALVAVLAASVAVPAIAAQQNKGHQGGPRIERMIERFDSNGNGAIELEEISAQRTAMFNSVDADQSGTLNKDELAALSEIRRSERDQAREEMRAERQKDREERRAERQGQRGEGKMGGHGRMGQEHAGRGEGMRGEGRGMGRHGGPSMERLDADNNGEISAQEFAAMETRMFERFDRNGDNKIDVTDFYRNQAQKN
jgi:Ca2+-binding EF-hand superfamily protein